jgi:mono/diheme cytochrome c family protein
MGKFIGGIVFTLLVIAIGGYCFLKLGMFNTNADQTPSRMERRMAGTAVDASVEKGAADLKNPLQPTDDVLSEGMHIYVEDCAGCHGSPKEPNSVLGASFNPHVPQFMKRAPDMPDNQNFYITKHGVRMTGMPAWGKILNDDKLWKVTTFLSHMEKLPPAIDQEWKTPTPQPPPASGVVPKASKK